MLFIVGCIVVFGCVLGGYQVHGDLRILWQPIEYVIIVGAGIGAAIISHPGAVLKDMLGAVGWLFKRTPFKKSDYLQLLQLCFNIFKLIKTKGILQVEAHIEEPYSSDIFTQYPLFLKNKEAVNFFCDNMRLMTLGIDNPYVMGDAMDEELKILEHEGHAPVHALTVFGESLPALGIVAAVLGVIVTMSSISEPPEVLGGLIAAALVGTFSGILLSYGLFSPMASFASYYADAKMEYYKCIKSALIANMQGNAPAISVELVRKTIPLHERPTFQELEEAINK